MKLPIELEREEDGRWIAEVPSLAGVMTYGMTLKASGIGAAVLRGPGKRLVF